MSKWQHQLRHDECKSHLFNKAEPRTDPRDVHGSGDVVDGLQRVLCWLDTVLSEPEPDVLELLLAPRELVWVLDYSVVINNFEELQGILDELLKRLGSAHHIIYTLLLLREITDDHAYQ